MKRPINRIYDFFVGDTLTLQMAGGNVVWAIIDSHDSNGGAVVCLQNVAGGLPFTETKRSVLSGIKAGHITVGRQAAAAALEN